MRPASRKDEQSAPPSLGQWVQRIDDERIGRVALIARAGQVNTTGDPFIFAGDVVVSLGGGSSIVTREEGFWAKWRALDLARMADCAIRIALEPTESQA